MTLGVLGGGQLGRMLALAAHPLNVSPVYLDPSAHTAMRGVATGITASWEDPDALASFARAARIATWEFENIPVDAVRRLAERIPVYPPVEALEIKRDRWGEKTFLRDLGIPVAAFAPANDREELRRSLDAIGFPCVIKTRRHGYDGKGQMVLDVPVDADTIWQTLGEVPLIVEDRIPFDRELAIVAVRSRSGEERFYPLTETRQSEGILRFAEAPASDADGKSLLAEDYASRILRKLDYVGTLALELFQLGDHLLANEMAPRVHNSGHWTIEGAVTSQFENHIRAGFDWPLGSTEAVAHSVLVNLIGAIPDPALLLEWPGAHVHLYGKEPRPGRKVGHVTFLSGDPVKARDGAARLQAVLESAR